MGNDITSKAESHSKFRGGHLQIQLESGDFVVEAGAVVRGRVNINQLEVYEAKSLALVFKGTEMTCYAKNYGSREMCEIVSFSTTLKLFKGNQISPGQYQIPFEIKVPDWIPGSMIHFTQYTTSALLLQYQLEARLVNPKPVSESKQVWARQRIIVQRKDDLKLPALAQPVVVNHVAHLKAFMGSASESKATVTMPKMIFTAGEKIPVRFSVDNSQSSEKVKHYAIKIIRKTSCGGSFYNTTRTIVERMKDANCPAKGHEDVVVEVQIPPKEVQYETVYGDFVSRDDLPIKDAFSCTTVGKYASLRYYISIEIKHGILGEKEANSLVLKREIIIQTPSFAKRSLVQHKEDHSMRQPANWQPVVDGNVIAEPIEQANTAHMNDYYQNVMAPSQEAQVNNLHKDVEMEAEDENENNQTPAAQ